MYFAIDTNNSCDLLKHCNIKTCIHGNADRVSSLSFVLYSVLLEESLVRIPLQSVACRSIHQSSFHLVVPGVPKVLLHLLNVNFTYSLTCMFHILKER
jgi:hypothetical protein